MLFVLTLHAEDVKAPLHNWKRIEFAKPPNDSPDYGTFMDLSPDKDKGLRFDLNFGYQWKDIPPALVKVPKNVVVRLHLADGKILDGKASGGDGFGHGGETVVTYIYFFPWQPNVLEEAWLEVHLPERVCWLEIPYGFTRNPNDPLALIEVRAGRPKLAAAMKDMGEKDVILGWSYVEYQMGRIQNNWRLKALFWNPDMGRARLELFRESGAWDLHAPRTAMSVVANGESADGKCMSIHMSDDAKSRSDGFKIPALLNRKARDWADVTIKVDDKAYKLNVPSSMVYLLHGIAEPQHKATIRDEPKW